LNSDEWLTIKFRYKAPLGDSSKLIVHPVKEGNTSKVEASENFRWSAAVVAFGMLLRDSEYAGSFTYQDVLRLADSSRGLDKEGYRAEFRGLVKAVGLMHR
jgi:Ca-activated chloride channel family protein